MLLIRALGLTPFLLLILSQLPAQSALALDTINLGPLFYMEKDSEKGTKTIDALGPFVSYKRGEHEKEYGFRPIFYNYRNYNKDMTSFDFLYPLSTHRTFEGDTKFQMLVYIFFYRSDIRPSGFVEKDFTFFPFVFSKRAEDPEESYFAFFPFGGRVKNKYGKDEISFFLFPLFMQTKKDGVTNNNFIWPFIGSYHGEGVRGGRLWPVYGKRYKPDTFSESFALWPIFLNREIEFMGYEAKMKAVMPFYYGVDFPGRKQRTYLWPFFNTIDNTERGFKRWDMPWFFVSISRGSVHTNRLWPLYSKRREEGYETGFLLWPLYQYKFADLETYRQERRTFALFLYKDIKDKPIQEGGKSGRAIHFWPLFSFKSKTDGPAHFHLISPLETFLPENPPRERNWAPFWRIFNWERDEEGNEFSSFLWNTLRTEHTKESTKIELRPIIPLISIESGETRSNFSLLGGFLGYSRKNSNKTLRFLYIPVNISGGGSPPANASTAETMILGDV